MNGIVGLFGTTNLLLSKNDFIDFFPFNNVNINSNVISVDAC